MMRTSSVAVVALVVTARAAATLVVDYLTAIATTSAKSI